MLRWVRPHLLPARPASDLRGEIVSGQEAHLATPRPSVTKRQREQVKRERQLKKAEKRAQRKLNGPSDESEFEYQHEQV